MLTQIETACANTILNCFFDKDEFITHMKIQKLLYFSYGVYLSKHNTYMVENRFQAWTYGPVLPTLYHKLKDFGDAYITKQINFEGEIYAYTSGEVLNTIKTIVNKFGHHSAFKLSEMTHVKDGPWFKTVQEKGYKQDIDINLIKNYFSENPDYECKHTN